MSWFLKRCRDGRTSWTGPIRSSRHVATEALAWVNVGWTALIVRSTPEVWSDVRAWQRATRERKQSSSL